MILACEAGSDNLPAHMDGSINWPCIWIRLIQTSVNQFIFGGFVNEILANIEYYPVAGDYDND